MERPIFAQRVFSFAAEPPRPVPLAHAWLVILDTIRRATCQWSFYDDNVRVAAPRAVEAEFAAARARVRGAVARLRVLLAVRGPAAPLRLP